MGDVLEHYGIKRRSGRYPWGSGEDPMQSNSSLIAAIDFLRKEGCSEREIAESFGITQTELRKRNSIARAEARAELQTRAVAMRDAGHGPVAIGKKLGINESSVRSLLNPSVESRKKIIDGAAERLRDDISKSKVVDVGLGVSSQMGITDTKLRQVIHKLKEEGYQEYYVKVDQLTTNNQTNTKVLAEKGMRYPEVMEIVKTKGFRPPSYYTDDGGFSWAGIEKVQRIDRKRILVRYDEDGGTLKDGTIELRPGVKDLDLGKTQYAQVRIGVKGDQYMKGMAFYSDDIPSGYDVIYNVNKKRGTPDKDVFKQMKTLDGEVDEQNPFGSSIKRQRGALNLVNEAGDWGEWSKTLASQVLSKQSPTLAKQQLRGNLDKSRGDLDAILALTNPTIKKKLLLAYADGADGAATDLKAMALPRQKTQVILPVPSMKKNEIYAPNFENGENVVLIRFPHGGKFEIPELIVNNRAKPSNRFMRNAVDAVGIHPSVAERLSGADFDGDTVLVIPNRSGAIKTAPALKGLEGFNPKERYPKYEGMKVLPKTRIATEMGGITNLITDMQLRDATPDEIARAIRHSMVVIDAHKHELNYKQSAIDNGIAQLKEKYQGGARKGASTLISRASAGVYVDERELRKASEGGPIDPKTGKLVWTKTGRTKKVTVENHDGTKSYIDSGEVVKVKTKRMLTVDDANALSSGTVIERVYADYANGMKALANEARREYTKTPNLEYSREAAAAFKPQVQSLKAKVETALANHPLERRALVVANQVVRLKQQANPEMSDDDLKKVKRLALATARKNVGADRKGSRVQITPKEWEAIQAGAISDTMLRRIIDNADLDHIKELATPRSKNTIDPSKLSRARALESRGYTQSEIASALGVSVSTVNTALKGG